MAAQLCKFTESHLIVHVNMLTLWYINYFNNATKEGRKEERKRDKEALQSFTQNREEYAHTVTGAGTPPKSTRTSAHTSQM